MLWEKGKNREEEGKSALIYELKNLKVRTRDDREKRWVDGLTEAIRTSCHDVGHENYASITEFEKKT